ncbi:hypothetical protein ACJGE4_15520 [Bacillus velezensis]|uniref:hypothetical protein n=1 Tax=Bacillus velezensis TaxID=492670 RepID=UPI000C058E41|nr:hypothetical protein [Bacillus velezensis]ATO12221.1 hypothetical protein CRH11_20465 [Bacillus velezensis]AZI48229.1 hypothetical protein BVMH_15585 [Bacillus velezensis]
MGYIVKIHVGNSGKSGVLTRPILAGKPEHAPWVFEYRDEAAMKARKLREGSSLNIWCTVEEYNGSEAV